MRVDHAEFERQMAMEAAQTLPNEDYQNWCNASYTQRVGVCTGHQLIVFRWMFGEPHIIERLRVGPLKITPRSGLVATIYDEESRPYYVTNTPLPMMEGKVFCHLPFKAQIKSEIMKDRVIVGFPLVVKTEGNPYNPEDPKVCLLTLPAFQGTFPKYRDQ